MNWFKKDKYQNIKKTDELIKNLLDFSRIKYCKKTPTEIEYLKVHPEIRKRKHQNPEYRRFFIKLLKQHKAVELEDIKEDDETPEWVKERRKIEKKNQ